MIYFDDRQAFNLNSDTPITATQLSEPEDIDLRLTALGELQLNRRGDLSLTSGHECIIGNLLRRVTTPVGGYERSAFNNNGAYELVNEGWSDPLISALSAPLTPSFAPWAVARLNDITAKDSRLTVLSINLVNKGPNFHAQVYYTLDGKAAATNVLLRS